MRAETRRASTREATTRGAPGRTPRPPATLEGWYLLHQLFRIRWPEVRRLAPEARHALGSELRSRLEAWNVADEQGEPEWSGAYGMVGGGVDLMLLHFRSSLDELGRVKRALHLTAAGDHLTLDHDYVSVVELGLYGLTLELEQRLSANGGRPDSETWARELEAALAEQREKAYVRRRLYPRQPEGMPWACYYPMNKRRGDARNWYTLPLEERGEMMRDHGEVGRRYAGRISQIISGSVGLDDWEWAVTLFAADPLDFKNVVTDMRYDRASAEFAEFGRFYVGRRLDGETLERWFTDAA